MQADDTDKSDDKYRDAGVDIEAGNRLVSAISPDAAATHRPGVMAGLGGFGGLFDLKACGYKDPILVAGTDGVGTKLRLALETGRHDGVGQDLVAMCVNDLVVQGAEPLFFLDYAATGKLDVDHMATVIKAIAEACHACGCALIGGETAEMPGMYQGSDYDLAGFAVGAVERDQLLTGDAICAGDRIIGIASTGAHSNGFSLIRKIVQDQRIDLQAEVPGDERPWAEALMAPTALYVQACLALQQKGLVHGFAHITGGGLVENIPRCLPDGLCATIDVGRWPLPPLFTALQRLGGLSARDMVRSLNCGIGMVAIIAPAHWDAVYALLRDAGHTAWEIGHVHTSDQGLSCHITDDQGSWGLAGFPVGLEGAS